MDYYNEIEPYAADWIENLIYEKQLPPGLVDRRSIEDVTPNDLKGFTQCHFYAGICGWPIALQLAGWPSNRPVWTGSNPCQPFSAAGSGLGFADERHLWPCWHHLIRECKPAVIFGEQVASKAAELWLDLVQTDMEALGHAFGAIAFPAASIGAQHARDRAFWVSASPSHTERNEQPWKESRGGASGRVGRVEQSLSWDAPWESALAWFRTLGDGLPRRVGATDAARNAIVPQQAAEFIASFMEGY